ncbi:MAG: hypothetical protein ABI550_10115 [Ignavibacteriaceae bacterium]
MKKIISILYALIFFSTISFSQSNKGQVSFSKITMPTQHYQEEYTIDSTIDPGAWDKQKNGMHVSFATTDESCFRSEVPQRYYG